MYAPEKEVPQEVVYCCCRLTPTLLMGSDLQVRQPASLSMWPTVPPYYRGPSRDPGLCVMWLQLKSWCVSCGCVLQMGHSQALDSVSHKLLVHKLKMYNIPDSLISNRKQTVQICGTISKWTDVKSGVPQG